MQKRLTSPNGSKTKKGRGVVTRDPERTSASILAAATKEFTEKGYGGARIDAIAHRSGSNKRMIYHYFGGKEELYLAVLESAYSNIRSAEGTLRLTDLAPTDAIERLCEFTWSYFLEHPEFLSLLNTENLHRAKYLKRSVRVFNLHSPLTSVIADILDRGVARGEFRRGLDPVHVYITIASIGFFYLSNRWTLSTIFRRDLSEPKELKAWGAHIARVVLSALRP